MATATKTNPELWERCKRDARARMGGKHSARAMQLATQLYKKRGGGYSGAKPTAKNNSLKKWGKQKWQWSGGEKKKAAAAVEQGGRGVYLPEDKIKRLKATKEGKKKLRAAERKKSKANREGRQYSSHGLAAGTSLKSKDKKKEATVDRFEKLAVRLRLLNAAVRGGKDFASKFRITDRVNPASQAARMAAKGPAARVAAKEIPKLKAMALKNPPALPPVRQGAVVRKLQETANNARNLKSFAQANAAKSIGDVTRAEARRARPAFTKGMSKRQRGDIQNYLRQLNNRITRQNRAKIGPLT